jgi:DNA-binding LacI/PurR family transcriptional regulator
MQTPARRTSIGAVARAAGVDRATASRALANHPHVAAATRARILALARQLGYRPEPALAANARDRWLGRRRAPNPNVLAYIVDHGSSGAREPLLIGARAAAKRLGYRIQVIDREAIADDAALAQMLSSRAITGLLLRRNRPGLPRPELPWAAFAIAHVGLPPDLEPWADGAISDTFALHRQAMAAVLERGYRRPGLVLFGPRYLADEVRRVGGALAAWSEHDRSTPPPPVLWLDARDLRGRRTLLRTWLTAHRIDAVLGQTDAVAEDLRALGHPLPGRLGFVGLSDGDSRGDLSRIVPDLPRVGETAVELVAARLHQRRLGLPDQPRLTLVPGAWHPGSTLGRRPTQRRAR